MWRHGSRLVEIANGDGVFRFTEEIVQSYSVKEETQGDQWLVNTSYFVRWTSIKEFRLNSAYDSACDDHMFPL